MTAFDAAFKMNGTQNKTLLKASHLDIRAHTEHIITTTNCEEPLPLVNMQQQSPKW